MILTSKAFSAGSAIPRRYTADGENVSPPLEWEGVPPKTAGFALICDDPDAPAGTWVHWVIFNIPGTLRGLKENLPNAAHPLPGALHGSNDFRKSGYGGPSPPRGTHRYFFSLYALDAELPLPAGATKPQVLAAIKGHVLAEAKLMGTYLR